MKRELAKIFGALALCLALVTLIWWHRKGAEKETERKEKEQKVVSLDFDKVDRMLLAGKGAEIVFQRRTKDEKGNYQDNFRRFSEEFETVSEWRIVRPVETLPDAWSVNTLIQNLKNFKSAKTISEKGEGAADYHLDSPAAKVEFFEKGAKEPKVILRIGDQNTAGSGLYVQTSASPKILLADLSLDYLRTRKFSDWRKKEILGFKDPGKVKRITVEVVKKSRVTAVRGEKGTWELTEPQKARVDSQAIETYLNEIQSLRANDIVSDDAAKDSKKYGFDKPYSRLTFYCEGTGGEEKKELVVGKLDEKETGKDFAIRRSDLPQIFMVSGYQKEKVSKDFARWVAKNPFDLDQAAVTSVEIERKDSKTELWKKEGKWEAARPAGMIVDDSKLSSLLSQLIGLKGKEYLGKKGTLKAATPSLRITLQAGDQKREVSFFTDGKKEPEGRATPSGIWYRFGRGDYDAIVQKASNLSKAPTPVPTSTEVVPEPIAGGKGK